MAYHSLALEDEEVAVEAIAALLPGQETTGVTLRKEGTRQKSTSALRNIEATTRALRSGRPQTGRLVLW